MQDEPTETFGPTTVPRTAILLPPKAASFWTIAGLPLIRRTALSAQRAGFTRVVAMGGDDTERLRATLAADRRTGSIPIVAGPHEAAIETSAVAFIPSDCLVTADALRAVVDADLDGHPLLYRSSANSPGILLTSRADLGAEDNRGRALAVSLDDGLCLPIADQASARNAERQLFESVRAATAATDGPIARLDRTLSLRLSRLLVRTPLRPNHITVIGTTTGLGAAALFAQGSYAAGLAGALIFWIAVIVDGSDGEVARLKFQETRFGQLFDVTTDNLVHVAIFLGMGIGQVRADPSFPYQWVVALLLGGFACASLATYVCLLSNPPVANLPPVSRRARLRQRVLGLFEALMNRDFAYLLVVLALIGRLGWFLWGAAFGTYAYALGLTVAYAWRDAERGQSPS